MWWDMNRREKWRVKLALLSRCEQRFEEWWALVLPLLRWPIQLMRRSRSWQLTLATLMDEWAFLLGVVHGWCPNARWLARDVVIGELRRWSLTFVVTLVHSNLFPRDGRRLKVLWRNRYVEFVGVTLSYILAVLCIVKFGMWNAQMLVFL